MSSVFILFGERFFNEHTASLLKFWAYADDINRKLFNYLKMLLQSQKRW